MTIPAYETLDPRATERSFIDLFKDLISSNPNGILGNTVFSAPLQSFQYDTAVSTVAAYRKQLYDTYTNPVASDIAYKRIGNMSTQLGIPQVGQNFIKFLYDHIATSAIESIIGHHGGQQAQKNIINAANAIGAVRSGDIGDLTNLRQLNENNQLGLRFAMDAYKSNFNAHGEIDIGQTHGLTLDQATMISNAVLQDKSQYDAFVKTAKDKNPQLGDEELRKFRNGIGTSEAVASAFSKQIKEFSGGINQFVAAVSKMTGDFEEAINFMQRSTDGKLFDASKEAAKLRKNAVALATNMRIVAADSGMSAQELYLRAGMMSSVFDAAQGRTSAFANMFANKASSTNLGAIGAAAYARWTHANPGATNEQRATAAAGISANIADYGQGDMSKMNVIMARLVDEKQVTKEEAEEIARRGNAEQMYTFLQRKLGGRLNSFLGDGRVLAVWRRNHSRTLAGLDLVALGEGLENEREEKGARNLLNKEFEYIAAQAGGAIVDSKAESSTMLDAYTDAEVLQEAGLATDDAKKFSAEAKKGKWDQDTIKKELKTRYEQVDITKLDTAVTRKRAKDVQEELDRLMLDAYTDTEVLQEAGLAPDAAEKFSAKAKKEKWDQDTIIQEAGALGIRVDTQKLSAAASKKVVSLAAASTVLSQSEKAQVKEAQIRAFGREVTEEDKREANRIVATRELGNKVNELRLKWNSAETEETKTSILSELSGLFKNAYEGANGLSLTSTPEAGAASTVDAVIEKNITFSGELKNSPESQKNVISAIRDAFSSEYTKTGSVDAAWEAAENKAKEFGPVSVNFSREARVKAIRDALEIKTIENVVNKFFSSIVGVPDDTKDAARRTALIEIKDRYHQLKKEHPEADSGELIRRAILGQDTPQDANSVPFRQDGFQGFLDENPGVVTHAAGEAYFDTARGLTYSKDANVTLTSEDARREAASIARRIAKGENREAADARHAFSAAQWTEDAANAAIGMRQFTSVLADATRVLNNYVSVAHILKADRRDAEAQNMGLLPTQQLSPLQKQSLIDRHGLGRSFVDKINFEAARRAIGDRPELSDDTQKNEWIVKNVSAVLKNVSGNGVPTDQDVLKEVERLMGQDFRRYVENILTTENKDKNKDDPTIKDASQILAAIIAGPTATSEAKTNAVLEQTLHNSGYGDVDQELIAPIKELTNQTIEKAKAKVVELTKRDDIDWNDPDDVITAIAETLNPDSDAEGNTQGEETVKTEATTASPSARVAEAATTAEITTPSTSSPRGTSYNSSSDEDTNRPGPWSSLDPRLNSNVKVAGISDDLTDIVNRILTTVTTFRSI